MGFFDAKKDRLFTFYKVEIQMDDYLVGGRPQHPNMIEGWMKSQAGIGQKQELAIAVLRSHAQNTGQEISEADLRNRPLDELNNMVNEAVAESEDNQLSGFAKDHHGPYLEGRWLDSAAA